MGLLSEDNWREKINNFDIEEIEEFKTQLNQRIRSLEGLQEKNRNGPVSSNSLEFRLLGTMIGELRKLVGDCNSIEKEFENLYDRRNDISKNESFTYSYSLIYR